MMMFSGASAARPAALLSWRHDRSKRAAAPRRSPTSASMTVLETPKPVSTISVLEDARLNNTNQPACYSGSIGVVRQVIIPQGPQVPRTELAMTRTQTRVDWHRHSTVFTLPRMCAKGLIPHGQPSPKPWPARVTYKQPRSQQSPHSNCEHRMDLKTLIRRSVSGKRRQTTRAHSFSSRL